MVNPLPHMPIFGSSNSAANKIMMSKLWTDGVQLTDWSKLWTNGVQLPE